MSMTDIFRSLGRADALKLREEAYSLSGTQIIDREHSVPAFDPQKDYSAWYVLPNLQPLQHNKHPRLLQ